MPTLAQQYYNKKYYSEHKEKLKFYRERNKEKYRDYYMSMIRCEDCNCMITRINLNRHQKSKKHQRNIQAGPYHSPQPLDLQNPIK